MREEISNQELEFDKKLKEMANEWEAQKGRDREMMKRLQELFEGSKTMLIRKMEEMLETGKCFSKSLVLEESSMRVQQDKNLLHLIQGKKNLEE